MFVRGEGEKEGCREKKGGERREEGVVETEESA